MAVLLLLCYSADWSLNLTIDLQARVRELRMSLERVKPAMLPSLKDALSDVVDVDDAAPKNAAKGVQLAKLQRPPPVMDDNLWDEITTEVVKRKSMHDPAVLKEDHSRDEEHAPVPCEAVGLAEEQEQIPPRTDEASKAPDAGNGAAICVGLRGVCACLPGASHRLTCSCT